MAQFSSFSLSNFRGAKSVTVEMPHRAQGSVVSLIGLNESGKTTILEGISRFGVENTTVSSVFDRVYKFESASTFIPMDFKAAFDGDIEISAKVILEDTDIISLEEVTLKRKMTIDPESMPRELKISKILTFENSVLKKTSNLWSLEFAVKSVENPSDALKQITGPTPERDDIWLDVANAIERALPTISYFPTFLVDVPDRIFLEEHPSETALNRYYREVIQDILQCLTPKMSLQTSVIDRIREFRLREKSDFWISLFFGTPSKSNIDAVFQKMSGALTKNILGSWSKVFGRSSGAKSVIVDWNIDLKREGLPFLTFSISDGDSRYAISERSLGFRWFFSFLLFTAFKQATSKKTVFLFDEPAANLHAKAQAELLENFAKIASGGNQLIYSTHSHHMINPQWLSAAYIVENKAVDYDSDNSFALDSLPTNVTATKYRVFVSKYPSKTNYFQPVVEKLDYITPEIIGAAPYLVLEGITDYHAFRYAKILSKDQYQSIALMPGTGAGASGPLISYLLGKGERFLVLLDDDKAGAQAARRYRENWMLTMREVQTIGELKTSFSGKTLEKIISKATKEKIKEKLSLDKEPSKKQIGLYLAEVCARAETENDLLSQETLQELRDVLNSVELVLTN